jgi:hypothetical protein
VKIRAKRNKKEVNQNDKENEMKTETKLVEIEIRLNNIIDSIILNDTGNINETKMMAISTMVNTNPDFGCDGRFVNSRDIRFFTDSFSLNRGVHAGYVGIISVLSM